MIAFHKVRVLSIATDAELLWLRHAVLQSAGFDVFSTQNQQEALARIQRGEWEVVLLGHSLSIDVRRKLAHATRTGCPHARILKITNRKLEKPEVGDVLVYGFDGPETLIDAIAGHTENHSE